MWLQYPIERGLVQYEPIVLTDQGPADPIGVLVDARSGRSEHTPSTTESGPSDWIHRP